MERFFSNGELLDKSGDTALSVEDALDPGDPVVQTDGEAGHKVRELLEPMGELGKVVVDLPKDLPFRKEGHRGSSFRGLAHHRELGEFLSAGEFLAIDLSVAPAHLHHEVLGKGVHRGDTHAVEASGHFVPAFPEFRAGVQGGEDELHRVDPRLGVDSHGDSPAVIPHGNALIFVDDDIDFRAEAGEGLVHSVIHDLIDHLEEAIRAGGTDVHPRPLAHGLHVRKDFDFVHIVVVGTDLAHGPKS